MPLLGIFKKSNARSKTSTTASNVGHNASNISLDDDDYVSIASPNSQQPPASSSRVGLPFRKHPDQGQQLQPSYLDPLLEPPPRRSSLFQTYADDPSAYRSTQSLPDGADRRASRSNAHPQQVFPNSPTSTTSTPPKRSMFSWRSNKERSRSVPTVKQPQEDTSFNLKSFRHVRPDSPTSLGSSSPALPPLPRPMPTSAMPPPPISFQVTSRRPRGNSISDLSISPSQQTTASQQKMAAGAFRQAARRSSASLTLTDSPVLSPVASPTRSSLDDRPPPSLLPPPQVRPSTPTRPVRPQPPPAATTSSSRAPAPTSVPRTRTNAFALSSSSSSSSEDEDEDSDSTGDGVGLARKTTIKPRSGTLPPLSATVREQIQRATPPADPAPPRAQSSLGMYGPGARQRASLSVGALSPSAKEARTSIAIAANARMLTPPRPPPKPTPATVSAPTTARTSKRAPGSDTSESASDSDEDAPLSSLVPPRRPGTAMSSHSSPGAPRKPLVDLGSPSTLTGRPVRAPPPLAREEDARPKARLSTDFASRASTQSSPKMSPVSPPQGSRMSQVPSNSRISPTQPSQGSRISQAPLQPSSRPQSSRASQVSSLQSSRTPQRRSLVSLDAPTMPTGLTTRSNLSPPTVAPPTRPFARRESPASSTGDSSSGKAPLTPRDGSDLGRGARSAYSGSANRSRHGHGRKPSVTFEDEQEHGGKGKSRERDSVTPQEVRLRERRRTEARAAIELGNVVNGPPPVDEDDVALGQHPGTQAGWAQQGMQIPIPPVPPMFNIGMNMSMPSSGAYGFGTPSPVADPAYLAAHHQAMAIAKQTFQYAVAQQALAAANEEWERSSNAGAQWGGSQWGGGSAYGLGGMGMGMRTSTMFPPAPRSMYAGSVGGVAGGSPAWGGAGSVYGEPWGPSRQSMVYSQGDLSAAASPQQQQRPVRPRTKTAPSASAPPVGAGRMPPPSSFRGLGH